MNKYPIALIHDPLRPSNAIVQLSVALAIVVTLLVDPVYIPLARASNEQPPTHVSDKQFLGALVTVGGLLVAGKLVKDGIDDSIDKVDQATAARLAQARAEVERIIKLLESKYRENLSITLESLDRFAAGQFTRAYDLILDMSQELQRIIGAAQAAAIAVIERAATTLRETIDYLAEKVQQVIIVAAESGVWVVDNLWETIISVIALAFIAGLLLLTYAQVGALIRADPPPTRLRIAILGGLGSALFIGGMLLLLWGPARQAIMARTVSALQQRLEVNLVPEIYDVIPSTLEQDRDVEVKIVGANLPASQKPIAMIGAFDAPVTIAQDGLVIIRVTGDAAGQLGAQPIVLRYPNLVSELSSVVEFIGPGPDLVIEQVNVLPEAPIIGESFELRLRVRNRGGAISQFSGEIDFGNPDVPKQSIDERATLPTGGTREITLSATYPKPGDYTILARILGTSPSEPTGPARDNNQTRRALAVRPREVGPVPTPGPRPTRVIPDVPPGCQKKPYLGRCFTP